MAFVLRPKIAEIVDDSGAIQSIGGNCFTATGDLKIDDLAAPDDNTDLNASTAKHGLCPKLSGNTAHFLRGDGAWASPPGGTEAFPVGSIFVAVVSTDPATLLGYGTWAAIGTGRVPVGIDSGDTDFDTLKETGGAKTHTLTSAQMPVHTHVQDSHNHTQDAHTHTQNSHNHTQDAHTHVLTELRDATTGGATTNIALTADTSSTTGTKTSGSTTATNQAATATNQNATATNQAATATNQNAGSGSAHPIMNPYFVVKFWERTA